MNRITTVNEAVHLAKQKLLGINLPAAYSRIAGIAICDAIDLLQAVEDAWAREEAEQARKAQEAPEIEMTADEIPAGEAEDAD